MSMLIQVTFVILVILVFLVVFFNLKFANYLKFNHNEVWLRLNKPSWAPTSSKSDQLLMKEFLEKNGYLGLNDPKLNSLIDLKNKISMAAMIALFIYGGMFLAFMFKR